MQYDPRKIVEGAGGEGGRANYKLWMMGKKRKLDRRVEGGGGVVVARINQYYTCGECRVREGDAAQKPLTHYVMEGSNSMCANGMLLEERNR